MPLLFPPHLLASCPNPILAKLLTFLSYLSLLKNFSSICCLCPPGYPITSSGDYPNNTPTPPPYPSQSYEHACATSPNFFSVPPAHPPTPATDRARLLSNSLLFILLGSGDLQASLRKRFYRLGYLVEEGRYLATRRLGKAGHPGLSNDMRRDCLS